MGLACDNLLSVELVTADGATVRASDDEHPELFWALHGGGGNFGVATSFTFRLHPLPSVTAALLVWNRERGPEVVRAYRDLLEAAPDEIGGGALYLTGPAEDFVPEQLVGELTLAVLVTYSGGETSARAAMAPMLALGPEGQMIAELPYAELQCMLDDPPGYRNYWSAEYLDAIPDEAVDRFCARAPDMIVPSPSQHVLFPQGGAVARGPSEYPVPWRRAAWCVHPFGLWEGPRGRPACAAVGERHPGRPAALGDRRRVPQLHRRRGPRPAGGGLRPRELRPTRRGEGRLRSGQRLPAQPQHPAALASNQRYLASVGGPALRVVEPATDWFGAAADRLQGALEGISDMLRFRFVALGSAPAGVKLRHASQDAEPSVR
jgi:hypothetical protein